ncbi:MAG: alpha/beta hydrolase family protein [Fimbriimonas sp.]
MVPLIALLSLSFDSREVKFPGVDGVVLNGTLLLPARAKNVPAVVLLPGSGPTDRDGNSLAAGLRTDLLKSIAERLANDGIASVRFDKRATPGYRSVWPKTIPEINKFFRMEAFSGDADGAIKFLRSQPGIDPKRVGMIGHSEGSLYTLQLADKYASTSTPLRAIVSLSGVARPMDAVIMDQLRLKLPQQLPANQVQTYLTYAESALKAAKEDKPFPPNCPPGLQGLFNGTVQSIMHGYTTAEPVRWARGFRGPALVVNGEFDNQVSPTKDAQVLFDALKSRKRAVSELFLVPKASHNLKVSPSFTADTFDGPVAPGVLDRISGFLKKNL